MKVNSIRIVFTLIFSLLSTAVASVMLYTLPVLYYAGYQTQVPYIIAGFAAGALIFSSIGTVITYYTPKPLLPALIISAIAAAVLLGFYKLSGPVNNIDIMIGSFASESFATFFATMFQSYPQPGGKKGMAAAMIGVFTVVNIILFLVTAEVYLSLGQAYLPNIIVYLEVAVAVLGAITLLLSALPLKNNKKST